MQQTQQIANARDFRNIQISTNHFAMQISTSIPIYHYAIEIPNENQDTLRLAIKQLKKKLIEELFIFVIADHKNIYSPKIIKGMTFQNPTKLLGQIDTNDEILQLVHIKLLEKLTEHSAKNFILGRILKQVIKNQFKMVSIGKRSQKLFWPSNNIIIKQFGLEIWKGIEWIFKPCELNSSCTSIVIDAAFKILRNKSVLEEIRGKNNYQIEELIGQTVLTTYNKKFYRIDKIDFEKKINTKFQLHDGTSQDLETYYKQKYNIILKDKTQPLIVSSVLSKKDKIPQVIYLIPEICSMTGLTDQQRSDFHTMKEIAYTTKPNVNERVNIAQNFIKQLKDTQGKYTTIENEKLQKNIFREWGIDINLNPMDIQAKEIRRGHLYMGVQNGNQIKLNLDSEQTNLDRDTQTKMYSTPQQNSVLFACVHLSTRTGNQAKDTFLKHLSDAVEEYKFDCLLKPKTFEIRNETSRDIEEVGQQIKQWAQSQNKQIGIIIFLSQGPKKKARLYVDAKRYTMQVLGCPSQIIIERTLEKNPRSIVNKILVQINAKIGGSPWVLEIPQSFQNNLTNTMICGTDNYRKQGRLSVTSFCSTIDKNYSRYYSQAVPSSEFSANMQPFLYQALFAYLQFNKILPNQVIIYRDGAGVGQEKDVTETDVPSYQQAIQQMLNYVKEKKLDINIEKIDLVVILCNKRVAAKFFTNKSNPASGTMVDDQKVVGNSSNFYLISQKVIREGTPTPTMYKILHNEIGQQAENDLKVLTYRLCWLFYNYNGPIKIPAPVRYAHCLCNFIGENHKQQQPFIPNQALERRGVLFFI